MYFSILGMASKNTLHKKEEKAQKAPVAKERKAARQPVEPNLKEGEGVKGASFLARMKAFLANKRTHRVFGAMLVLFSLYLFIAFSSYVFTWKMDHDKVSGHSVLGFAFLSDAQVENWLGRLGAAVSHFFVFKWFGLASFGWVFMFFIGGLRIATGIRLLPVRRAWLVTFFGMLVASLLLGYLSAPESRYLGGGFGWGLSSWLVLSTGKIGALLAICTSGFIYLVVFFNPSFKFSAKPEKIVEEEIGNEENVTQSNFIKSTVFPDNDTDGMEPNNDALDYGGAESDDLLNESVEMEVITTPEDDNNAVGSGSEDLTSVDGMEVVPVEDDLLMSEEDLNEKLTEFEPYDPKLDLSAYSLPTIDLLVAHGSNVISINKEELEANKNRIVDTLNNYGISIDKIKATVGPTVTLYEIIPAPGVRISKIKNLEDDIALSLSALGIRIIAPIPGKGTIGIEVPNSRPDVVSMRTLIQSDKFQNAEMELPVALGKTISNETFVADLTKMPHLLMAGATGQGKSVGLNAILVSVLYKKHPAQVKFVLVDPKKVELTLFNKIERHFLAKLPNEEKPIITDVSKVVPTLTSLCIEMDDRYALLEEAKVRTIKEYNEKFIARRLNPEKGHRFLPYIILVVDEFADLIMTAGKEVETPIARLAQLARAIGIHLIIATQRPSVNIITGTIKANFPARIAFRVTSKIDSRTILDTGGADQLIGRGDMLYSTGNDLIRLQCGFVDTPEVEQITEYIGSQRAYPDAYLLPEAPEEQGGDSMDFDQDDIDDLFDESARIIVTHQQGSASLLQRKLKIGYNRAGRLIDQLEQAGIIGPFKGSKAREVLYSDLVSLEQFLSSRGGHNL